MKMQDVKISIIIPVYNAERYLEICAKSLLQQTYENIELIFVDDGSTDGSGKYLDTLKTNAKCKVIHQKNGGVQSARRVGIENATGNYITFVDADDYVEKTAYEECYKAIIKYDPSMCKFGYRQVYSDNQFYHPTLENDTENLCVLVEKEALFDNAFAGLYFGGYLWNKIWKKEIIQQIDFRDDFQITEDSAYVWDSLKFCDSVVVISKILYDYRYILTSMTKNSNVKKYLAASETWNYLQKEAEERKCQSIKGICLNKIVWYMKAANAIAKSTEDQRENKKIVRARLKEVRQYSGQLNLHRKIDYYALRISWKVFSIESAIMDKLLYIKQK